MSRDYFTPCLLLFYLVSVSISTTAHPTKVTAKYLGWELSRGAKRCQSCAESYDKQKIVPNKNTGEKVKKPNGRFFQDLATIKPPKLLGMITTRLFWQLLADEAINMKFSSFHETKVGMVEPTCIKMNKFTDIAGEMKHLG